MLTVLRSIALLDRSFGQVCIHRTAILNCMMTIMFWRQIKTNINLKQDGEKSLDPKKTLKRRVGYDDNNEINEEHVRSIKRNRMDVDAMAGPSSGSGTLC